MCEVIKCVILLTYTSGFVQKLSHAKLLVCKLNMRHLTNEISHTCDIS